MNGDGEERADRARPALWVGVGLTAIAALFGLIGPHAGSALNAPRQLEARVEAALAAAGFAGLDVTMNGQQAVLAGMLGSNDEIRAASNAALTAAGGGGPWAGGVTSVRNRDLAVGPIERPFAWRAVRTAERVTLSGAIPSERARGVLLARTGAEFPNAEAVDQMRVVGGAPSANWTEVAADALASLAGLDHAQVRLVGEQMVFIGDGPAPVVNRLRQRYGAPQVPFRARVELAIAGRAPANPVLQGLDLASGDPEQCGQAFARLMDANVINFAPGSAEIDESSRAVIDELGSVALRCDGSTIEVAGHTDNQGPREFNMQLSRERAEAVAQALISQGVAPERLRAEGYGPDRPRAPNRTASGQAANRRIEFSIVSEPP